MDATLSFDNSSGFSRDSLPISSLIKMGALYSLYNPSLFWSRYVFTISCLRLDVKYITESWTKGAKSFFNELLKGNFGNDGEYTVTSSSFGAGITTINVVENIPSTISGGNIGLIETLGAHNGFYTIANIKYIPGSPDCCATVFPSDTGSPHIYPMSHISYGLSQVLDPNTIVVGDTPHTIITFVESVAPIPVLSPGENYAAFIINSELMVESVIPYSNVTLGADEGFAIEPIISISTGLNTFTVGRDFSNSNVSVGDTIRINHSMNNNGIYTITAIAVTGSPSISTIFTVAEIIPSGIVDGECILDIGANMFCVSGDYRSRFTQGKKIDVIGGVYQGVYNVLYSDFVNGKTRIRVLEDISFTAYGSPIGSPIGSPAEYGLIQDHLLGYDEWAPLCGDIEETRLHVAFTEELIIQIDGVGSPVGSP